MKKLLVMFLGIALIMGACTNKKTEMEKDIAEITVLYDQAIVIYKETYHRLPPTFIVNNPEVKQKLGDVVYIAVGLDKLEQEFLEKYGKLEYYKLKIMLSSRYQNRIN